jgi:DNA invertase Pin-like site-specific DNA recombinase
MKVFLYARKSTDDEERQILSIDAQRNELREYAKKQGLEIIHEFIESMTAKEPGRPIFNDMLRRVESGEADTLLAWHPDRLARNSIDGGKIIYLVDTGKLTGLKFPSFWFDNTPQGKFVLNMAFGQSKYYVDALSENVRRGIREKIRRGVYPHKPPLGYVNEPRLRTIEVHQQKAPLVRQLFETYATGRFNYDQMTAFAAEWGLLSHQEKPLARSLIPLILSDRFYIGFFKWRGEYHEGKHDRIISVELFERVQKVLEERGRAPYRTKAPPRPLAFLGFVRCDECGARVTAERQKGYNYYRCTKKLGPCDLAGYVREEFLAEQMQRELHRIGNPDERSDWILGQTDTWRREGVDRATTEVSRFQNELADIEAKVQRLLDVFLEGAITREDYAARKAIFFTEKARLREKISEIKTRGNCWLEPLENFLRMTKQAENMAISSDFSEMRGFFQKIGSNLYLRQPKAGEIEDENRMLPPSERAGQKADPAARRGGLAARADLPTQPPTSENRNGESFCNSLDPSRKNRAARVRRSAPENPAAFAANPDLSAVGRWSPHRVSNRGNLPPRLRVEYFGPWKLWAEMPSNLRALHQKRGQGCS